MGTDYFLWDWSAVGGDFTFAPTIRKVTVGTYGFENWVYQMSDFQQEIGGFRTSEPLMTGMKDQVFWEIDNIRFHHPAEHKINDTQYDLEIQIFGNDKFDTHMICYGKAAVSILFKIDDTTTGSDFFDW